MPNSDSLPSNLDTRGPYRAPLFFEEFFDLGLQENVSPFLTPAARQWGVNLTLKASLCAALLLLAAFILSFAPSTQPLSNLLLIFVYFLAGIPALIESLEDLGSFDINIDILMTLAAFSSLLIGSGMEGGLLLVLFALSGSMEDAVTSKAKGSLSVLHKLSPTKACVVGENGLLIEKAIQDVPVGTSILIKAGEIIPLDGKVTSGSSSVNLVHLTGENMPVTKKVGDTLPAGGRNLDGALTMEVEKSSSDSTLARIIRLVTQAQEARPALQRWFDKLSQRYATTIIALSFIFAATLPWFINIPYTGIEGSIYRALAFLIAASPCALIIAIPIAYLSAVNACARNGILLKGGVVLDALASCNAAAFDKTGTLTHGNLTFKGILHLSHADQSSPERLKRALGIANALERNAVHPIAQSILKAAQKEPDLPTIILDDFKSIPGYGLQAQANLAEGKTPLFIGSPDFIYRQLPEAKRSGLEEKIETFRAAGELLTVLLVGEEIYLFRFRDIPRPYMQETVMALRKRGWQVIMLTGDHKSCAKRIAEEVGITDFRAELDPEGKLREISLLAQTKKLAMVGDGINDAPALARATVGICMGKLGSMSAVEAADVILLQDNIELLDWLVGKAKATTAIVKQNVCLAAAAILIATVPALAGFVPLWVAVILHEGGTVLVGLNALRLLRR